MTPEQRHHLLNRHWIIREGHWVRPDGVTVTEKEALRSLQDALDREAFHREHPELMRRH
jgi:hypothetical protein